MSCTVILALVLVASLPAASAVTPALRGLALTADGSDDHKNTTTPGEVIHCNELIRQGFVTGAKYDKLRKEHTGSFKTVLGGDSEEAKLATDSLKKVLPQVDEIWQEVDALLVELAMCPDSIEDKEQVVEGLKLHQQHCQKFLEEAEQTLKPGLLTRMMNWWAASAVTPALRGSALTAEGSVDAKNTMTPDEVDRTCKELIQQGVVTTAKYNKLPSTSKQLQQAYKEGMDSKDPEVKRLAPETLLKDPRVNEFGMQIDSLLTKLSQCQSDPDLALTKLKNDLQVCKSDLEIFQIYRDAAEQIQQIRREQAELIYGLPSR